MVDPFIAAPVHISRGDVACPILMTRDSNRENTASLKYNEVHLYDKPSENSISEVRTKKLSTLGGMCQ